MSDGSANASSVQGASASDGANQSSQNQPSGGPRSGTPQSSPGSQQAGRSQMGSSQTQGDGKTSSDSSSGESQTGTKELSDRAGEIADQAKQAQREGRTLTEKDYQTPITQIVNGQKVTKTLKEWINVSRLEQASHQRFNEAAQLKQQMQQLAHLAKNNPLEFIRLTGHDPNQISQQQLASWIEEQNMTEEQRELKALRAEKAEAQRQAEFRKQQEEQQAAAQKDTNEYNQMVKESLDAWKESGLPDDPYWGQRMAAEVARAQTQGIPLTWKEAAAIVKHDWQNTNQRILGSFQSVEDLANFLGEPVLKKLREYEIARITSRQASRAQKSAQGNQSPASRKKDESSFVNSNQYNDYWSKLGYRG